MQLHLTVHQASPDVWARQQFQGTRLGHCARRKRLVSYAQALAEQPGKSIPELFLRKYDIDATYEFLDLPEATPDAIQAGHRRLVWAQMRTPGRYLLFEDTTYVSYSHRPQPIEGLGPIGTSDEGQGFLLHSILVARIPNCPSPTRPDTALRWRSWAWPTSSRWSARPAPKESRATHRSGDCTEIASRNVGSTRDSALDRPRPTRRFAGCGWPTARPTYMNT